MGWFSVTSTISSSKGGSVGFILFVENVNSLDELQDVIAENGCVIGDRYRLDRGRDGERGTLRRGERTLLAGSGIASVTEFPMAVNYAFA